MYFVKSPQKKVIIFYRTGEIEKFDSIEMLLKKYTYYLATNRYDRIHGYEVFKHFGCTFKDSIPMYNFWYNCTYYPAKMIICYDDFTKIPMYLITDARNKLKYYYHRYQTYKGKKLNWLNILRKNKSDPVRGIGHNKVGYGYKHYRFAELRQSYKDKEDGIPFRPKRRNNLIESRRHCKNSQIRSWKEYRSTQWKNKSQKIEINETFSCLTEETISYILSFNNN